MKNLQFLIFSLISTTYVFSQECENVVLTEDKGVFISPNYPSPPPHELNCKWTINAPAGKFIHLHFTEFDVVSPFFNCDVDYVNVMYTEVKSEAFCSVNTPPAKIKSETNTLTLQLVTDDFNSNGKGFRAQYEFVDEYGKPISSEKPVEEEYEDDWDEDDWYEEEEESTTSSTTTAPATKSTISTKSSTTAKITASPATTTSTSTTEAPRATQKVTTKLLEKILATSAKTSTTTPRQGNGISNNPGAMSGAVLGAVIGIVLIMFCVLLIVAFVHWKRHKNKRINLRTIEINDDKNLISDGKKYKKQNNRIVRIPEAETFPL